MPTTQSATLHDPHRADIARRAGEIANRLLREADHEDKIRRQVRLGRGVGNDDTTTVG